MSVCSLLWTRSNPFSFRLNSNRLARPSLTLFFVLLLALLPSTFHSRAKARDKSERIASAGALPSTTQRPASLKKNGSHSSLQERASVTPSAVVIIQFANICCEKEERKKKTQPESTAEPVKAPCFQNTKQTTSHTEGALGKITKSSDTGNTPA